jgi:hypothetical protein
LVREDWRKWVEAVKRELEAWDDNNAVEEVDILSVPVTAKIVPLGELYTMKRDGTYKYRQYLMGNLLREGIDYDNNFSTTISSTGITVFYALATTSARQVGGWDAVAGYLQTTEQFDIYAFLPTHADYSRLEYEEIAKMRSSFLKIFKVEGIQGIKKLARNFKREYRAAPNKVYKCHSSIYGNQSAGMEFEKLMNSVHIVTAKMKQTQPEPSMYLRIKVDSNDIVIGYLVAIAFVDDVRYFGTDPEVLEYKEAVLSRLKVKFEKPPVEDFVSIETYQNLDEGTFELKMPKYFEKAKNFFQGFRISGFKTRTIPLTTLDEKYCFEIPSSDEIDKAKHLPFLQAIGILSYPASNCKFEMRYAVSVLGSKRSGWSSRHFDIAVKLFEYALTTKDIGLIYSKGLDPHGDDIIYAYADASLRIPRPQGCRIIMMNGAAISFVSKMQTITAPSSTWAESVTLFDCSTDVLGIRNLLEELGHLQESPTTIYQDNKSAIQIANNRGSLGRNSRAMDLKTLATRNRIEDHLVEPEFLSTKGMLADMGSKALPLNPFAKFRDTMNGYALVRSRFPNKEMSPYVYELDGSSSSSASNPLENVKAMIMKFDFGYCVDDESENEEEEEEIGNDDIEIGGGGLNALPDDEAIEETTILLDVPVVALPFVPNVLSLEESSSNDEFKVELDPNWFQFNHHWQLKLAHPNYQIELFELDDLPDPRLYNIDVVHLRRLARQACSDCGSRFDPTYENYMLEVEKVNLQTAMMDNYVQNLDFVLDRHLDNLLNMNISKQNPLMFFPAKLHRTCKETRRSEINKALNKFVIRLDVHIEAKTWYDSLDNVYWGVATDEPSPKLSWLRFIRWRRYFLHLVLSGICFTPADADPQASGPPCLREIDKERMDLTNCFALCQSTGQYVHNNRGCYRATDPEEREAVFPNVQVNDIIYYHYKSIWSLRDYDNFQTHTKWNYTRWNNSLRLGYTPVVTGKLSLQQKRVFDYLKDRYPEWGRRTVLNPQQAMDNDAWTHAAPMTSPTTYIDAWQEDLPLVRPQKQQRLEDD